MTTPERIRRRNRRIAIGQVITGVALVIAIVALLVGLNDQTASRRSARYDSCELFRGLVLRAVSNRRASQRVNAYINNTPLRDCHIYAQTGQ